MKILAIDLGEKRTGIAICDKNETISYPLEIIVETDKKQLIEKIFTISKENKADLILVGFAKNMDGSIGQRAKNCEKFAKDLKEKTKLPVALWDERQTTKLASRFLIESNTKKRKKKKVIDGVAATIILDSFIQFRKNANKINLI